MFHTYGKPRAWTSTDLTKTIFVRDMAGYGPKSPPGILCAICQFEFACNMYYRGN